MERNIPILYYHFIKSPSANTRIKGLFTNTSHFEWQLKRLIKAGFNFITFEDFNERNLKINADLYYRIRIPEPNLTKQELYLKYINSVKLPPFINSITMNIVLMTLCILFYRYFT